MLGCVGVDASADVLIDTFRKYGVGGVKGSPASKGHRTSKTIILLVEGQDRRYFHVAGANKALTVEHISRDWLSQLRVFYLGGLFAMPGIDLDQLATLLQFCRSARSGHRSRRRDTPRIARYDAAQAPVAID